MNTVGIPQQASPIDRPASIPPSRLLTHPAVLAAIGLLAINDYLLRVIWPSALTGKVGDFCWLFAFPVVLATAIRLLAPAKLRSQPEPVLLASMAITGSVFISANTLLPVRLWIENATGLLTGIPISITQDPSDAIALLAFVPLWILHKRSMARLPREPRPAAYLLIALGILLSLANSAIPDFGIDCLSSDGAELQASSSNYGEVFRSTDGGLTWDSCDGCSRTCSGTGGADEIVRHPEQPAIQYRYVSGVAIERSQDGGSTWSNALELKARHEASEALYNLRKKSSLAISYEGPLSAIIDPASGNAVFAMGYDGLLVHVVEDDRWEWIGLGEYRRMESPAPTSAREAADLLFGEIRISILFGLMAVTTILIAEPNRKIKSIAVVLPWAVFVVVWAASPALNRVGYFYIPIIFIIFAGYIAALLHLLLFSRGQLRLSTLPWQVGILLVAAIVFVIPYVLWSYLLLPRYTYAQLLSLAAGLAVILIGRGTYVRSLRRG